MQYSLFLLAGLAALAAAQNQFTMTTLSTITAGKPYTITWAPSPGTSSINLVLRQGDSSALSTVETIASNIPNSGSFTWTPSPTLPAGTNYAFEIVDASNADLANYSGQFTLDSSGSQAASSAAASVPSLSAASAATDSSLSLTLASSAATLATTILTGTSNSGFVTSASEESSVTGSVKSTETGKSSVSGSGTETSAGSKTTTGSATSSNSSAKATGNGATVLKAGGAVLGFVGMVMAAL